MKRAKAKATRLRIRIVFEDGSFMGPGKADLLEGIRDTGSIASAGRQMGMSYKRAWMLVEVLNGMFHEPLVNSSRGGAKQGGAELTEFGAEVLALYRSFEAKAGRAGAGEIAGLEKVLAARTGGKGGQK